MMYIYLIGINIVFLIFKIFMSPTEVEGDILFLVRILLDSALASA